MKPESTTPKVKKMRIRYDFNFMMSEFVGARHGVTSAELERFVPKANKAHNALAGKREAGELPFFELPYKDTLAVKELAAYIRKRFDNFVLLGIGGSALGPLALQSALCHPFYNLLPKKQRSGPRMFFADNVDPDNFGAMMEMLDLQKTVFAVVTKSGGTAETMATYMIAREAVIKALGKDALRDHFVAVTDPEKGNLRKILDKEGYRPLDVPPGVGGRFSVFTPVGLLPAAVTGMDIDGLLAGAAEMDRRTGLDNLWENPAYMFSALQYIADIRKGKHIAVMMPYSNALKDIADWFRQLWAESLGKKHDLKGRVVHTGQTPVKALGATDQHSQVQLYMEGPNDKTHTFLRVEGFGDKGRIPKAFPKMDGVGYLGGRDLAGLINAEQTATATALMQAGRPSAAIIFPEVNEFTVGQALYMLEVATAFSGGLYGIDPFDQPGVEHGKLLTYAMMGRAGYEDKRKGIEDISRSDRYVM